MPQVNSAKVLRIIDANVNRTKEGLRVCEDINRFIWDSPGATRQFKNARHRVAALVQRKPFKNLAAYRSVETDVGRPSSCSEFKRNEVADIYAANLQRVKESLRVLEEFVKLFDKKTAQGFKELRYKVYGLEHQTVKGR